MQMNKIKSGFPFYGQHVGILVFDGKSPRIPGDAGHGATFSFPVCYELVEGSFLSLARKEPIMRERLIAAVNRLKAKGVLAVAGDCGLMSLYQKEIAEAGLLAAASSLCQIPTIWQMVGREGKIGIITGDTEVMTQDFLAASGCEGIPLALQGMQDEPHFRQVIIEGSHDLQPQLMEQEVAHAAELLVHRDPQVKAIVLECSNLATYAQAATAAVHLPVFDLVSAVRLIEYAVNPPVY